MLVSPCSPQWLMLFFRQTDLSDFLWNSPSFQIQELQDYWSVLLFQFLQNKHMRDNAERSSIKVKLKKNQNLKNLKFLCDSSGWIRYLNLWQMQGNSESRCLETSNYNLKEPDWVLYYYHFMCFWQYRFTPLLKSFYSLRLPDFQ